MSASTIASAQRFTASHPCPICNGYSQMPSGHGIRCYGFLSDDGLYAHCSRENLAGPLQLDNANTYAHILQGPCRCGATHNEAARPEFKRAQPTVKVHRKVVKEQRHTLRDESGNPLFIHCRSYDEAGDKYVWWEQLNGVRNLGGAKLVDLPLYGVHELGDAKNVILAEGEPARDALNDLGFKALGTVCGAKSVPGDAALRQLLDVPIVALWGDNDPDGIIHMTKIGNRLLELGHPDVRLMSWPDAPPKGDAADFIAAGGTADGVKLLARAAERFTASASSSQDQSEEAAPVDIWPELGNLPIPTAAPTMPSEFLPEPLRAWIVDIADIASIPIEMVAAPAITGVGSVIGRSVGVRPWRYNPFVTVPNFWGLVVSRPGWMKSHAVGEALKPIGRLAAAEHDNYEARRDAAEADIAALQAELKDVKRKMDEAAKGGTTLDKLKEKHIELTRKIRETKAVERRFMTHDATVEKLAELLRDNSRGMLVVRDEVYGLLRSFEKSGRENDRQFYLEAWGGTGSFTSDRIARGTIHVPSLTLSIMGGIQPGRIRSLIEEATAGGSGDDGLLQRFQLTVWPDKLEPWKQPSKYPDKEVRDRAFAVFESLSNLVPSQIGTRSDYEGDIPYLEFSQMAQPIADKWHEELEKRLRSDEFDASPAFASHMAKYRSLMPELALTFHLIDVVGKVAPAGPITEGPTRLAAAWCEFLELHAKKLYDVELDRGTAAARALAKKIKDGAIVDRQTVREIYRNQWSGLKTDEVVIDGLAVLAACNWVRLESVSTGGRASQIVRIHPDLQNGGQG